MQMTDGKGWHVLLAYSGAEWQAYTGLLRNGIHAFFPYFVESRRKGHWQKGELSPQFPGYLFASIRARTFPTVRQTIGVRDIMRQGIEFVVLNDAQMRKIRSACADRLNDSLPGPRMVRGYQPGMLIAVPHGDFSGLPAWVETVDKSGRVEASLGSLRVSFRVQNSELDLVSNGETRQHAV